jgi:hypothetical protein
MQRTHDSFHALVGQDSTCSLDPVFENGARDADQWGIIARHRALYCDDVQ